MMEEKRKATDIIIGLELKVDNLVGYIKNLDNNIKILLSQINDLKNKPQDRPAQPPIESRQPIKFEDMPKTEIFDRLKEQVGISDDVPVDERPPEDDELIEEVVHKGERRGARVATKPSEKVSVSQQILMPDGSPMFLASVEIMDFKGMLVKQTRTNTKGRWIAPLTAGAYSVHVIKRSQEGSKKTIELQYVVEIPASQVPLQLDPPDLDETMV